MHETKLSKQTNVGLGKVIRALRFKNKQELNVVDSCIISKMPHFGDAIWSISAIKTTNFNGDIIVQSGFEGLFKENMPYANIIPIDTLDVINNFSETNENDWERIVNSIGKKYKKITDLNGHYQPFSAIIARNNCIGKYILQLNEYKFFKGISKFKYFIYKIIFRVIATWKIKYVRYSFKDNILISMLKTLKKHNNGSGEKGKLFFEETKKYDVIFPGASEPSRRLPLDRFMDIASQLENPVFIGGPEMMNISTQPYKNMFGKNSLQEAINYISSANVVYTNDTVAYHIAQIQGIKTILFTGGKGVFTTFPYNINEDAYIGNKLVSDFSERELKKIAKETCNNAKKNFENLIQK